MSSLSESGDSLNDSLVTAYLSESSPQELSPDPRRESGAQEAGLALSERDLKEIRVLDWH